METILYSFYDYIIWAIEPKNVLKMLNDAAAADHLT